MSIVALYLEIGEELEATFLTPNCQGDGKFDESTRAVITRRHGARGYPKTGFLNTPQIKALLTESVSAAHASSSSDKSDDDHLARRRLGGGTHQHRGGGGGGPGGLIGGMMEGLFGRRRPDKIVRSVTREVLKNFSDLMRDHNLEPRRTGSRSALAGVSKGFKYDLASYLLLALNERERFPQA